MAGLLLFVLAIVLGLAVHPAFFALAVLPIVATAAK